MNCARVINAFSHPQPAVASAELANYLNLNKRQYLCQLLSMSPVKPTQPYEPPVYSPEGTNVQPARLNFFSPQSLAQGPPNLRSCFRKNSTGVSKKHVVFADDMGLELTAVLLFAPESFSSSPDQVKGPPLARLKDQQLSSNNSLRNNCQLGFPQPTKDFTHLQDRRIQMESYNISKNTLRGTVYAMQSAKKAVYIRVTFDSWKNYKDILCTSVKHDPYQGLDVFSFEVTLPQTIDPNEQSEFYFLFWPVPGFAPLCDNNKGQNYKVCVEKDGSNQNQSSTNRFYSMLSTYRPYACRQANVCLKETDEPQYLKTYLLSRNRAELSPIA
ncbi:protein phosphatase 1 regulatory subunit 3B [Kryptolebias marmoratus]|uniref:Protein phosphatase 1 regulatory subunit 3B-like n=1 Tax=Kryptolebias marmoratus TaxID=37003 RepID=A0A3Q3AZG7_KRYMA|nr:protein phosphatase 1 regulatory subunit 3B [Kryptolebias marmoratus]